MKKPVRKKAAKAKIKKGPKKIQGASSGGIKKEAPGIQQIVIEQAKFSPAQAAEWPRARPEELPHRYGQDKLVLQVRDPHWVHAYWEVRDQTMGKFKAELKEEFYQAKYVLRVYDVSFIAFNGSNAHRFFDIYIDEHANNWYIDTQGPGRSWCVDLGLVLANGTFVTILRSNVVYTPLDGPSWITDEEWMIPDDMFARLYGLGFGLGSSPLKKRMNLAAVSSPGIASMASPIKKLPKEKKLWLVANCELIIYGATEPDAKVTVQSKPVNLRQDGTFTLRFALPDGKQAIPIKAQSADKVEERSITPIITRETR